MIFKLNHEIYVCCEEEGEIILPTETGFFNVGDYAKTCVVNRLLETNSAKMAMPREHYIFAPFFDSCQS